MLAADLAALVAVHEAAHAVAFHRAGVVVRAVSVVPHRLRLGSVLIDERTGTPEARAVGHLAGDAASLRWCERAGLGPHRPSEIDEQLALAELRRCGGDLGEARRAAAALVELEWRVIERLARRLGQLGRVVID